MKKTEQVFHISEFWVVKTWKSAYQKQFPGKKSDEILKQSWIIQLIAPSHWKWSSGIWQ